MFDVGGDDGRGAGSSGGAEPLGVQGGDGVVGTASAAATTSSAVGVATSFFQRMAGPSEENSFYFILLKKTRLHFFGEGRISF